jgi:hypothetical protein
VGLWGCTSQEGRLKSAADRLVRRVERHRKQTGVRPASLSAMGLAETEEGPLHYQPTQDTSYLVWFGTTLGESMSYHSETRRWERSAGR